MKFKPSTKDQLVARLEKHYGTNWKTPLAKDLGVGLSSVRRVFNGEQEVSRVWQLAIGYVLH